MTVLWLVGEPGIGKTTVARRMLELNGPMHLIASSGQKWTCTGFNQFVAAGHYGVDAPGMFDGADTVPYNGVKAHLDFWRTNLDKAELTLFDGDRFSYGGVVEFFKTSGQRLICCRLTGPAAQRRKLRGTDQNVSWLKGRTTKVQNFVLSFPGDVVAVETTARTPDEIASSILEIE